MAKLFFKQARLFYPKNRRFLDDLAASSNPQVTTWMRQFYTWMESGVVRPWGFGDQETDLAELCLANNQYR
jgi:hypothetical protein